MALTKDKIKRWYLILALIHLVITTFCIFMFSPEPKRELGGLIGANLMFHFMYGISLVSLWQYRTMFYRGKLQNFILFLAKAFSISFMVIGPLFSIFILTFSVLKNQPERATVFFAPMGLFIGGLGLWRFIREELENKTAL